MSFGDIEAGNLEIGSERPDSYLQLNERIKRSIFAISSNVGSLQALVKALGAVQQEDRVIIEKLNQLTEATRGLIRSTNDDLHAIGRFANLPETRKLQQAKLVSDLQNLIRRFQEISRIATLKEKEAIIRSKRAQAQAQAEEQQHDGSAAAAEDAASAQLAQSQLPSIAMSELAYQSAVIAERESNIREIESAMVEVHEIFRDLGSLVNEQQWMLDNIEANMESAHGAARDATSELLRAQRSQKARRRGCCFIICACIAACFVAILILSL